MFVVIFRAVVRSFDDQYVEKAARLRQLALTEFGCLDFQAATEGSNEIALSYWPDERSIDAWRRHPEHVEAQRLGKAIWYSQHSVEIAEIRRSYRRED